MEAPPQPLKLFVGQIPRVYTESDVLSLFASFGAVQDVTLLIDRFTSQSRGCAFVTFAQQQHALAAAAALHEATTLPGMANPLQVRPAESERKIGASPMDRKLYVGNLSSDADENFVLSLFSPHGTVEHVTVLRNFDGTSKGCAFVKLASHDDAQAGIAAVNGSIIMEGCQNALVAKFANADRARSARPPLPGVPALPLVPFVVPFSPPFGGFFPPPSAPYGLVDPLQGFMTPLSFAGFGFQPPVQPSVPYYAPLLPIVAAPRFVQREGPDGANLFIYHLPSDFDDAALASTFMPFGIIVSAKVFVDKFTKQSKCFGFVSYDDPAAAQNAIQAMDGFQIGVKRLKVTLKRAKDAQ